MITLRLGLLQSDPRRARELVEALDRHKGAVDTLWLTTAGWYPSIETHRKYAGQWLPALKLFREAGYTIGINIANTVGHEDSPYQATENAAPLMEGFAECDPYVGPDGKKSIGCLCWNSPRSVEYVSSFLRIYGEILRPDRFWYDDDLRATQHKPNMYGCFCDRCISLFNERYQSSFSREELIFEINYGDLLWRERFAEFCRRGLYEFTYKTAKAALEGSPDSALGLECAHISDFVGNDENFILQALYDASKKPVQTRPGGGYYNDKEPWQQFRKIFDLSRCNSRLPDYVDDWVAEIENLPGVVFGKSIGGILNEGTLDLAIGCSGLTFTDLQSCNEPLSYHEKLFAEFVRLKPYWNRLSALARNVYRGGVAVFTPERRNMQILSEDEPPFSWALLHKENEYNLLRLGVPLTHDGRAPSVYLLHRNVVETLTDAEIEFLLSKPVITDGHCVEKLCERGYGAYFPLRPVFVDNDRACELFTKHPINGDRAGTIYSENRISSKLMRRFVFEELDGRSEALGAMHTDRNFTDIERIGDTTVITEIQSKEKPRWAIFGYSLWSDIVSAAKRNQILGALDAIGSMPATLISPEQAVVIPSVNGEGKTVSVTVASACQSGTEELSLRVRRPKSRSMTLMGTRRNFDTPSFAEETADSILVTLPALQPYESVTLFLE